MRLRLLLATVGAGFVLLSAVYVVTWAVTSGRGGSVLFVIPAVMSAALGYLVVLRRPQNRIGVLLIGVGVSAALLGLVEAVLLSSTTSRALALGAVSSDVFFVMTFLQVFVLLPIRYPTGYPASRFWLWVQRGSVLMALLTILGAIFATDVCVAYPPGGGPCLAFISNPLGLGVVAADWADLGFLPLMLAGLLGLLSLVQRFRRSEGLERQQMKWLVLAAGFLVMVFALSVEPIRIGLGLNDTLLLELLLGIGYSSIPLACGLAVLRYRLYEIDRIISRTITYTLVAGALGVVYLGAVGAVTWLLPAQNALAVAGSTLFIAALFNPLRKLVQHRVDRRFNRPAYQAELVSEQFATKLRESLTIDELTSLWRQTVTESFHPSASAIWLNSE